MSRLLLPAVALFVFAPAGIGQLPKPMATGLKNPASVCAVLPAGPNAKESIYVTQLGERGKDGDGSVVKIENGQAVPFVTGLDNPEGICAFGGSLFVTDKTRVLR